MSRLFINLTVLLLTLVTGALNADEIRYELAESSRSLMRVGPNQSLDMLVEQIYPGNKELWPRIKQEIKRINPHAFNRYTGKLIVGERLKLVTIKKIKERVAFKLNEVGKVGSVEGFVVVTDNNGKQNQLTEGAILYEGDRVVTNKDARVELSMVDGAKMHVREDSAVRITEYEMKSGFETGSRSIIDLIKGGLRKITGAIGANPQSIYRFHTGVLTIGVRGTDYVVKLCKGNDCQQSAGRNDSDTRMHVVVLDGLITLQDQEGVLGELGMGQYAIATADDKVRVDDARPVSGMLNTEEQEMFDKMESEPEAEAEEEGAMWPWILGGALIGL